MRVSTGVEGLGMLGLPTTMGSFGAGSPGVEFTAIPGPVVEPTSDPFGAAKLDPSTPSPLAAPSSGHRAVFSKAWAQDSSDGQSIRVYYIIISYIITIILIILVITIVVIIIEKINLYIYILC